MISRRSRTASAPPVLVDTWSRESRADCRTVSPALEQLAHRMAGHLKLVKVDVDKSPALPRRFEVQRIPTLLLMDRGQVVSPVKPELRRPTRSSGGSIASSAAVATGLAAAIPTVLEALARSQKQVEVGNPVRHGRAWGTSARAATACSSSLN